MHFKQGIENKENCDFLTGIQTYTIFKGLYGGVLSQTSGAAKAILGDVNV
jgi:hypothetical protein